MANLTHADFGCCDGVHKAWIVVDVDTKDEARNMLPPAYRKQASVGQLCKFGLDELDDLIKRHKPDSSFESLIAACD